ncbi:MAG TPA: hypothetical protein PKL83_06820, partial [bacterium]|nr:hypothetical protein [bacterium]
IPRPEEQEPQQSNRHETYQRAMARIDAAVLDWFAGQDVLPEARVICLFAERVLVELYGEFVAISEIPNHLVEKIFDQAGKYLVAGIQRFGDQAPELARLRMLVPLISKREILDAYWVGHFWQTCLSAQFRQLIARKETAQQHGAIIVQLARETLDRDMSIYFINSAGGIAYEGNQFEYSFKLWQETLGLDAQNADALRYLAKGHMRYAATMMVGKRPVEARRIYEEGASWVGTYRRACSLTQGYGYAAERMIYLVQTDEWKELALADPDLGFEAVQSALQPVQHLDGQTPDIQARVGLELGKATLRYAHTVARPEQGGVCSGALRTLAEADQALIDAAGPAKDPEVQKKIWYYRVLAQSSLGEAGEAVKTAELIRKNLAGIPGERYVICYSLALQLLGNAGQLPWDEAAADPAVRMELEAQAESMLLAAQALLESVVLIDEAHLPYHVCQEYGIDSFAAQRRIGIDAKILQAKVYLELAALAERRGGNREAIQVYRHSALALVPQTLGLALERNFKITSMLEIIAQMVDVESMELLLAYHSEHDVRAMITVILGLGVEAGDEGSDVLQHKAFAQAIGGYSPDMLLPAIAVAATAARVVHPDMVHRIGVLSSEASVREGCRALAVDAALHQLHGAKTRQLLLEIMRDTANDASREDDPEVQAHLREVLQALHARRLELMYAEVDHLDDIHEEGDDTELLRVRYEVEYCLITNDYKGTVEVLVRYLQDLSGLYNFGTYRPMVRVIQDVVTNEVRTDFSSYAYVDAVCTDVDWFINLELFGQMAVIA